MALPADPYTYPGTDVLINKAGIRDQAELNRVEQGLAELGLADLRLHPVEGAFDLNHLKEIHVRLVGDLYDWAGERRTTDVQAMGTGVPYCRPAYLDEFAGQIFSGLTRDGNLKSLDQEGFSERLAYHWGEVTALHYFRDGNTRSQSAFFDQLSTEAGWRIDWAALDIPQLRDARIKAVSTDHQQLHAVLAPAIHRAVEPRNREQAAAIDLARLSFPVLPQEALKSATVDPEPSKSHQHRREPGRSR